MKLKLVCETCRHSNCSNMGFPGYEFQDESFVFLSDLLEHWNKNRDHMVNIELEPDYESESE